MYFYFIIADSLSRCLNYQLMLHCLKLKTQIFAFNSDGFVLVNNDRLILLHLLPSPEKTLFTV